MENQNELSIIKEKYAFHAAHGVRLQNRPSNFHWDNTMEIFHMLSGTGIFSIGKSTYKVKAGETCIINKLEYHGIFCEEKAEYLYMTFDPQIIYMDYFFNHDDNTVSINTEANFFNFISSDHFLAKEIRNNMWRIVEELKSKDNGCVLVIKSYITLIYTLLYRHLRVEPNVKEKISANKKNIERIKEAVIYINQNYNKKIRLEDIAKKAYMEPSYLSSCFRKALNVSVSDYIISLRVKHAAHLLRYSAKKITEIGVESGFQSISNFNQTFKKSMGLSPKDFRNKFKNVHIGG